MEIARRVNMLRSVKVAEDDLRDKALEAGGWKVLRFRSRQIQEGGFSRFLP
jgi:very-short-patch-repair endonuclease